MASDWVRDLAASRRTLERSSTAERVADILRARIIEGAVAPGQRLAEDRIREALGMSRNTLREAFRLLVRERLLVHEFGRGVFVARPTAADVADLYRVRRVVEGAALRGAADIGEQQLAGLAAAVEDGRHARDAEDWPGIGTANMRFHRAVTALAGSPRLDDMMDWVLAEMRLVFHIMDAPRDFHLPYLDRNRAIHALVRDGRTGEAAQMMAEYLDSAERQLLEEFARSPPG